MEDREWRTHQLGWSRFVVYSKNVSYASNTVHETQQDYVVVENGGPGIVEEIEHG